MIYNFGENATSQKHDYRIEAGYSREEVMVISPYFFNGWILVSIPKRKQKTFEEVIKDIMNAVKQRVRIPNERVSENTAICITDEARNIINGIVHVNLRTAANHPLLKGQGQVALL